jgi:hypothetical protein
MTKALTVSSLSLSATGVYCVPKFSEIFSVGDGMELLSALLQKTIVAERHRNARPIKEFFSMVPN